MEKTLKKLVQWVQEGEGRNFWIRSYMNEDKISVTLFSGKRTNSQSFSINELCTLNNNKAQSLVYRTIESAMRALETPSEVKVSETQVVETH